MVESDLMTQDRISNQTRKRGPTTAPLSLFWLGTRAQDLSTECSLKKGLDSRPRGPEKF